MSKNSTVSKTKYFHVVNLYTKSCFEYTSEWQAVETKFTFPEGFF